MRHVLSRFLNFLYFLKKKSLKHFPFNNFSKIWPLSYENSQFERPPVPFLINVKNIMSEHANMQNRLCGHSKKTVGKMNCHLGKMVVTGHRREAGFNQRYNIDGDFVRED